MSNLKISIGLAIGTLVLGIVALLLGIYFLVGIKYSVLHPARAYAIIGVGLVLIIAGIVALLIRRRVATANRN